RSTSPANTTDCWLNSSISATMGARAAAAAQAERPSRSASTGRNNPRNGKATISASAIGKTPYACTSDDVVSSTGLESKLPDGDIPCTTTNQLSRCRHKHNGRLSITINATSCIELSSHTLGYACP